MIWRRFLPIASILSACGSSPPSQAEVAVPASAETVAAPLVPELSARFRPHQSRQTPWVLAVEGSARLYLRPFMRARIEDHRAEHTLGLSEPMQSAVPCGEGWLFGSESGHLAFARSFLGELHPVGRASPGALFVEAPGARVLVVGESLYLVSCGSTPALRDLELAMVREIHATEARVTASTVDEVWTRAWDADRWEPLGLAGQPGHEVITDREATFVRAGGQLFELRDDGSRQRVDALPDPTHPSSPVASLQDQDQLLQAEAQRVRLEGAMPLPGGAIYVGARSSHERGFVIEPDGTVKELAVPAYTHHFVWGGVSHRRLGAQIYQFVYEGEEVALEPAVSLPEDAGRMLAADPPHVVLWGVDSVPGCEAACLFDTTTSTAVDLHVPDTPFSTIQIAGGHLADVRQSARVYGVVGEEPAEMPEPFRSGEGMLDSRGRVLLASGDDEEPGRVHVFDGQAGEILLPEGASRLRVGSAFWVAAGDDTDALWASVDEGEHWQSVDGPDPALLTGGPALGRCVARRCGFGDVEVGDSSFYPEESRYPTRVASPPSEDAHRPNPTVIECEDEGSTTTAELGRNPLFRADGGEVRWRFVDAQGAYGSRAAAPRDRTCSPVALRREGAVLICSARGETQMQTNATLFRVGFGSRPVPVLDPTTFMGTMTALVRENGEGVVVACGDERCVQFRIVGWNRRGRRTGERFVYSHHYLPTPQPAWVGAPAFVLFSRERTPTEVVRLDGVRTPLDVPTALPVCEGPPDPSAALYRMLYGQFDSRHPSARSMYGANWPLPFALLEGDGRPTCIRALSGEAPAMTLLATGRGRLQTLYWVGSELPVVECSVR